ncbi:pilus assembly protein PilM [Microbacterium sp. LRZ72]|uniref:pilus assembly protein PilM n=1 Tax=Microbacterium sp. LRZ72 TaxID=2942481 RepID=UPI0029A1A1FE|nr:pilus assembly protein PilM [Microbacterium sp. LRZ72]MDX2377136.1 pilus assembly protein PilM [Microbacterium sp. LRZ72]
MAKTIIGIEITERSVRAVEVTTGRAPKLIAAGDVPLPPGAAKDSEVLDPDAVAVAVRQLWGRAGIKGRRVVLGIGSRRLLVREYAAPVMKPELLRQALPFQVQDLLPVPVAQAVLDFYPVQTSGDRVHGLLVAAVAETVEQLITTLGKARLHVEVVDVAPFGLARVGGRLAPRDETVAMVHLGEHTSYVVVAIAGVPRFVRIIPVDLPVEGDQTAEAPAEALELAGVGAAGAPAPRTLRSRAAGRWSALEPAYADLVERVHSTIGFYNDREGAAQIGSVFVSGAAAAAPGVLDALAAQLPAPVRPVVADEVVRLGPGVAPEQLTANMLPTVGLTLGEGS